MKSVVYQCASFHRSKRREFPKPAHATPRPGFQPIYRSHTVRNCLMSPFFLGPLQMTALSCCGSIKPIDITPSPSVTHTGDHPDELWWTSLPVSPSMRGTLGPQMSISSKPTYGTKIRLYGRSVQESWLVLRDGLLASCLQYACFALVRSAKQKIHRQRAKTPMGALLSAFAR